MIVHKILVLKLVTVFFLVASFQSTTKAARILSVFPIVCKSHFAIGESLSLALAKAGHEVTLVSPFDHKSPVDTMETVQLTGFIELQEESQKNTSTVASFSIPVTILLPSIMIAGETLSTIVLQHPNMRKLMENRHYDLIIIDIYTTEAVFGLGPHFGAPTIGVSAYGQSTWSNDLVGNPAAVSTVPSSWSNYSCVMTPWQRMINFLVTAFERVLTKLLHHPIQRKVYNSVFTKTKTTFDEALYNVSLVLLNSHFSAQLPRPYLPNVIEVGGLHIKPANNPLPKKIQKFLDSATDGVIYFSLGTFLNSTSLNNRKVKALIKVFGSLKQKVIWKYEKTMKVPSNVMIANWLPQNDIFTHPNVKLFISHGGMLSTLEALHHAKPVLGIPFWGDQERNIECYVTAGWALRLSVDNLTESSIRWALHEMLDNPKYREKAQQASKAYHDRPMSPLDTAVYWTEYVIRHRGAPQLRSSAKELNFVQYHNLDVFMILSIIPIVVSYLLFVLFRWICCKSEKGKTTVDKRSKTSDKKSI